MSLRSGCARLYSQGRLVWAAGAAFIFASIPMWGRVALASGSGCPTPPNGSASAAGLFTSPGGYWSCSSSSTVNGTYPIAPSGGLSGSLSPSGSLSYTTKVACGYHYKYTCYLFTYAVNASGSAGGPSATTYAKVKAYAGATLKNKITGSQSFSPSQAYIDGSTTYTSVSTTAHLSVTTDSTLGGYLEYVSGTCSSYATVNGTSYQGFLNLADKN